MHTDYTLMPIDRLISLHERFSNSSLPLFSQPKQLVIPFLDVIVHQVICKKRYFFVLLRH